jgi:hypothetical protein
MKANAQAQDWEYRKPGAAEWRSSRKAIPSEWLVTRTSIRSLPHLLERALTESRSLLALEANWDEEGGIPYSPATWDRMSLFLRSHFEANMSYTCVAVPNPNILPGPEGSIDLHWTTDRRELLVNIPADPQEPAHFYGDDFGSDRRKGIVEPGATNRDLFLWLTMTD